jgi:peptide/nickel transport system permease protein
MIQDAQDSTRAGDTPPPARTAARGRDRLADLLRHPSLAVGAVLILIPALGATLAPWIIPYGVEDQHLDIVLQSPTTTHLFGTDDLGRDLLSRVVLGARVTLVLGIVVVVIAAVFGLAVGAGAGYAGGWTDELAMRATEVVMAFPSIVLAMTIVVALGPGIEHAVLAMILVWWPPYARLVRAEVLAVRGMEFVEAAVAVGQRPGRVVGRHILPNVVPRLIVLATMDVGSAIIAGAGLSFLGLGAVPPTPELGAMVSDGIKVPTAWWVALFPGLVILGSVLGFNFLGDGIRDLADPRLR